jgi:hypothetical protein
LGTIHHRYKSCTRKRESSGRYLSIFHPAVGNLSHLTHGIEDLRQVEFSVWHVERDNIDVVTMAEHDLEHVCTKYQSQSRLRMPCLSTLLICVVSSCLFPNHLHHHQAPTSLTPAPDGTFSRAIIISHVANTVICKNGFPFVWKFNLAVTRIFGLIKHIRLRMSRSLLRELANDIESSSKLRH